MCLLCGEFVSGAHWTDRHVEDEQRVNNPALRVSYDGFGSGAAVEQLLLLPPGSYRLSSQYRIESGGQDARLSWQISCVERSQTIAELRLLASGVQTSGWASLRSDFSVPGSACTAQWLRLATRPGDRRAPVTVWLDNVTIEPGNGS